MSQQIQICKVIQFVLALVRRNQGICGWDVEVPEVNGCNCNLKYRRMVTCCLPLLVHQHKQMINFVFSKWEGLSYFLTIHIGASTFRLNE